MHFQPELRPWTPLKQRTALPSLLAGFKGKGVKKREGKKGGQEKGKEGKECIKRMGVNTPHPHEFMVTAFLCAVHQVIRGE